MYRLKNWMLKKTKEFPRNEFRAIGACDRDPRFEDGKVIYSSPIREVRIYGRGLEVMTKNSVYRLDFQDAMESGLESSIDLLKDITGKSVPKDMKDYALSIIRKNQE